MNRSKEFGPRNTPEPSQAMLAFSELLMIGQNIYSENIPRGGYFDEASYYSEPTEMEVAFYKSPLDDTHERCFCITRIPERGFVVEEISIETKQSA